MDRMSTGSRVREKYVTHVVSFFAGYSSVHRIFKRFETFKLFSISLFLPHINSLLTNCRIPPSLSLPSFLRPPGIGSVHSERVGDGPEGRRREEVRAHRQAQEADPRAELGAGVRVRVGHQLGVGAVRGRAAAAAATAAAAAAQDVCCGKGD